MTVQWLCYSQNPSNLKEINYFLTDKDFSLLFKSEKEEIEEHLSQYPNTVVVIDAKGDDCYQYCESLTILYPQTFTILVGEEFELDAMKALRCGAKDILFYSSEEKSIEAVMKRAEKLFKSKENQNPMYKNGRVITACSTKGGVGKTTLIVNLATILSKKKYKVAVLDLNLQFGDVSLYYDVKPKKTIYEWVKEDFGETVNDVSEFMLKHSSGVDILAAPIRPEFSEAISEEHIQELIKACKLIYDYVLIDTAPYLTDHTITCLEKSDDILLMTFKDLATLKNNKILIETLEALSIKGKVKVILNRDYKVKGILPETVEKILELPIFARIPNKEKHITTSINEGVPFSLTNPRSSFSKSIESIANELTGSQKKPQKYRRKQLQLVN